MMRSLYSGVAGLKTHQTKMDVIGNNIANVNTVAYKSQNVTFNSLLYQTTQAASGANADTGLGGTNARQIGLGVKTGAISTQIDTAGSAQTTNNPFDIMITGESFFIVTNGSNKYFTRDGSFNVDNAGNLVMASTGYSVMGWQVDPETQDIKQESVSALKIMDATNMTYDAEATTKAYISGIMDANDSNINSTSGKTVSLLFYDKIGYQYTAKFSIHATDNTSNYYMQLDDVTDMNGKSLLEVHKKDTLAELGISWGSPSLSVSTEETKSPSAASEYTAADTKFVYTNSDGTTTEYNLTGVGLAATDTDGDTATNETYNYAGGEITAAGNANLYGMLRDVYGMDEEAISTLREFNIDAATGELTITKKSVENSVMITYDADTGKFNNVSDGTTQGNSMVLGFGAATTGVLPSFEDIEVDFSPSKQSNNNKAATISATSGDTKGNYAGRKLGDMSGVTISNDGKIYATYDNGCTKLLGQIAVANFANAAGLSMEGDNLYAETQNSGAFNGVGADISADGGYMTTGQLEMSNVDLSSQFTEMITTQRGFQANSRIITVSDTMLEELTNLKR